MTIKPIETHYKGYRFRSRLEARWAVFFDALPIAWEYEHEGFLLSDGTMYLPDFWLPQVNMFAEVKPTGQAIEWNKVKLLSSESNHVVLLLIGTPDNKPYTGIGFDVWMDGWVEEKYCLTNYHDYPQNEHRFYCSPGGEDDSHWEDTEYAANAARAARFEHDHYTPA